MRKIYASAILLMMIFCSLRTSAQVACNASFYLDAVNSSAFNAYLVNNSTSSGLVPPDSVIYAWSWGDGSSTWGVKLPTHTYTSAGAKTIVLFMTNFNKSCDDSFVKVVTIDTLGGFHKTNGSYTLKVRAPFGTGIKTTSTEGFASITPNIVSGTATLNFNGLNAGSTVEANIYSYDGKNVISLKEELNAKSLTMQTGTLKPGMYFVYITSGDQTTLLKFMKQ
jgi:hypothetical protein